MPKSAAPFMSAHILTVERMTSETNLEPNPDEEQSSSSDRSLLQRYQRGDNDAATELYLRYAERLRSLATFQSSADVRSRLESEDIVQSVFRTFFRRAVSGEYEVPEGSELWKLLLVIGLNKIRSLATYHGAIKRSASNTISGDYASDLIHKQQHSDESGLQVLQMTIDELLEELPVDCRPIVELRIAGNEVDQIAQSTKKSKRTVERILQTFRKRLREITRDVE